MIETMWQSFKRLEETMGLIAAERVGRGVRGIFQQESEQEPRKAGPARLEHAESGRGEEREGKEERGEEKRRGGDRKKGKEERRGEEREEKKQEKLILSKAFSQVPSTLFYEITDAINSPLLLCSHILS